MIRLPADEVATIGAEILTGYREPRCLYCGEGGLLTHVDGFDVCGDPACEAMRVEMDGAA